MTCVNRVTSVKNVTNVTGCQENRPVDTSFKLYYYQVIEYDAKEFAGQEIMDY